MEINNVPVRLTADIEAPKTTAKGKLVLTFNVAYNWRTRTDGGFSDVETTFFRCTLWEEDGAAEVAALGLRKGALLRVSGRWSKNPWTTNSGQARIGDNLTVSSVSVNQATEIRRETEPEAEPEAAAEAQPAPARARSRRAA